MGIICLQRPYKPEQTDNKNAQGNVHGVLLVMEQEFNSCGFIRLDKVGDGLSQC